MKARPAIDWHEGCGAVLWWRFPVREPPYVGCPLSDDWMGGYYTHWTPIDPPTDPDQRECNQCGWKDDPEWRDPNKGRWQCGRYPYGSCDGVMVALGS